MPEIAEVRVVASVLKKQILERKITKVMVLYPNIINGDAIEFKNSLEGKTIKNITTNGKWIIFNLGEYSLLSHLRMEGKYFYVDSNSPYDKHTHIIFTLDNGKDLRYHDVRKFGKMQIVKAKDINTTECIKKLGYEPDDNRLTSKYLLEKFKTKTLPIKSVLLDQEIINGLGNIYANEVLFASHINPLKKASLITEVEAENIVKTSKEITQKSYEMGGCTIRSYTSSLGVIGHYQDELKVHGKKNEKCPICQSPIKCIKINGRSTYYCENCQK